MPSFTRTLRNPSRELFAQAVRDASNGAVGDDWVNRAYDAANYWTRCELASSPFGRPESPLCVSSMWNSGEQTVVIGKS